MDPFRLSLAIGPLALYGLILGLLNMSRRPWLITGALDLAALAVALVGIAIVGPMELLLPDAVANRFGSYSYVWLLMLAFYGLSVSFLTLLSRPRLIVYNIGFDELRATLERLAPELDSEFAWAGDNLVLPNLGVQLHLENFPVLRNVSVCSSGERQHYGGWRRLELELSKALRPVRVGANPWGVGLVFLSLLACLACAIHSFDNPAALELGFKQMLRL
jgi:hypothetical protein